MIIGIKEKSIILTHTIYCLLAIATNVPVLLKTGIVVQGHIFRFFFFKCMYIYNTMKVKVKVT